MSSDLRPQPSRDRDQTPASSAPASFAPASFLDELYPGADGAELDLTPRSSRPRRSTTTSDAFGALDVGLPVSRLPERSEPDVPEAPVEVPAAARPERCPSCGARVRAEQDWCSLCHASVVPTLEPTLKPEPEPAAVTPTRPAESVRVSEDSDGQLALDFDEPGPAALDPAADPALDEAEVSRMLGVLARTSGGAPRGLGTRQARIAVAVGGGLGLTALLLVGMTALGSVLG